MLTGEPRTPKASTLSVRIRFFIDLDGPEPRSVWFDDLSLIEIGDLQFPAQGCQNNSAARCIDFGAPDDQGQGYNPEVMSEVKQEGDISYRELLPLKTLNLAFEPCETDSDGFPLSPLLLEIRFKDTSDALLYASSTFRTAHRASLQSRLDFRHLDPAYERSSEYYYQIGALGNDNDQRWKHWQFSFAKSSYQLLRALDGKFRLQLRMPNLGPLDAELHLPIDYISLRRSTAADHQAFTERERLYGGFFAVELPPDRPLDEPNYESQLLTTFSRDVMQPIFPHTRPAANDVGHEIRAKTAAGEIATLALGLYSQQGIADLSFEPTALSTAAGREIPSSNIELFEVVNKETRLHIYFDKRYALSPDHLRRLEALSITPDTTAAIWLKIHVPSDAAGDYSGMLHIDRGGQLIETINIRLSVISTLLDDSPHLNPLWVDPWLSDEVPDESLDTVLKLIRQTGFDPFLYSSVYPIKTGGQITGFNTERLERLIDRCLSAENGYGSRRFVLWISGLPAVVYRAVYNAPYSCSNFFLYQQLSTPAYQNAFRAAIAAYLEVAAGKGITMQFFLEDEPTNRPCPRIAADRLYPLIREVGGVTTVTYSSTTDLPLSIPPEQYSVPGQVLPPLTNLIDHKIWNVSNAGEGYSKTQSGHGYYPHFGFYTTGPGSLRNPIYNRFLHGIFALRTNATSVHAYAMSSYVVDPQNDYDTLPSAIGIWTYPDFLFAYPTWNDGLLPTLGLEGTRLGIQDAKYVATLTRLIAQHPNHPAALEAQNLLSQTYSRLGTDLIQDYFRASPRYRDGSYQHHLKALSETEDPYDYKAFTTLRDRMLHYISQLVEAS